MKWFGNRSMSRDYRDGSPGFNTSGKISKTCLRNTHYKQCQMVGITLIMRQLTGLKQLVGLCSLFAKLHLIKTMFQRTQSLDSHLISCNIPFNFYFSKLRHATFQLYQVSPKYFPWKAAYFNFCLKHNLKQSLGSN